MAVNTRGSTAAKTMEERLDAEISEIKKDVASLHTRLDDLAKDQAKASDLQEFMRMMRRQADPESEFRASSTTDLNFQSDPKGKAAETEIPEGERRIIRYEDDPGYIGSGGGYPERTLGFGEEPQGGGRLLAHRQGLRLPPMGRAAPTGALAARQGLGEAARGRAQHGEALAHRQGLGNAARGRARGGRGPLGAGGGHYGAGGPRALDLQGGRGFGGAF